VAARKLLRRCPAVGTKAFLWPITEPVKYCIAATVSNGNTIANPNDITYTLPNADRVAKSEPKF
jgi:hypothetical protein